MSGPALDDAFVARRTTEVALRDGARVRLRPIVPEDKQRLLDGFQRLSPESRYRRFMGPVDSLTDEQLRYLTEIDYHDHYAIAAMALDEQGEPGIGVARYVRFADDPAAAEAAVAVVDDFHGRGLGTLMLDALGAVALENGITRFRAVFLEENKPIRAMLDTIGARYEFVEGESVAEVDLPERAKALDGTSLYGMLRAAARGDIGGWRQRLHPRIPRVPD